MTNALKIRTSVKAGGQFENYSEAPTGLRAKRFSVSQLLTAGVAAAALLIGSFGLGLWPSAAEAQGSIRKFSGPLYIEGHHVSVSVHNPHATAILKATVVGRSTGGTQVFNYTKSIPPNAVQDWTFSCPNVVCTVEVNMANAILQPTALYMHYHTKAYAQVYPGDFSR